MRALVMLTDAAQVADGKLFVLGGGWNIKSAEPAPFGIAMLFQVPWDQANREHTWELRLLSEDGEPVNVPGSAEPVLVSGAFEVGRPPGARPGTTFNVPAAINSSPIPLTPGRYQWLLSINGTQDEDWAVSFDVME
jgi:uncharacterized protein DUF6941